MKVLFVNVVYGRGSTGRIVKELGQALERNGDSYMVAYGRSECSDDPHGYFIGGKMDRYLHAGLSRLTDRAGFYSSLATKKLLQFIRAYNPDVIHLHNLHGYYLNIGLLFRFLAEEYSGKVIWTLHDCWAMTGHCTHFTYVGCDKWTDGCRDCPQSDAYPKSILLDKSARNYREKESLFCAVPNMTIVTVSRWLKTIAEQSYLKKYPIRCIYNGIDDRIFRPLKNRTKEELGIMDKKMILLVSNGWGDRKGLGRAISVAAAAPADWRFVMIGMKPQQIAKLPDNIIGLEKLWNQEKLIEYYSAADVFFHPSAEETFGLVIAEALSCGTPSVVYNSTACPELIRDDGCGRIVELSDSPGKVVTALRQAMEEKHGESMCLFPLKNSIKQTLALYREQDAENGGLL